MDKTDYYDKMDTLVNDKQNWNETWRQHFNVNLTVNYLTLTKLTSLTYITTDWGAAYRNHPNSMDYQNYTNVCDP